MLSFMAPGSDCEAGVYCHMLSIVTAGVGISMRTHLESHAGAVTHSDRLGITKRPLLESCDLTHGGRHGITARPALLIM